MSKIRTKCEIISASVRKNSAKIIVKIAALDISEAVSILSLLNDSFTIILAENKVKIKIPDVVFDKMSINSDGESKITFDIQPSQMPLAIDHKMVNPLLGIVTKAGEKDDS